MIVNLTQHAATPEQVAEGVVDLPPQMREELVQLLTFQELPSPEEIQERAESIAALADAAWEELCLAGDRRAMIGGAPWLMAPLEEALRDIGVEPAYAFSVRETEEVVQPDGSVRKTAVFRHRGFITPPLSQSSELCDRLMADYVDLRKQIDDLAYYV